MNIKKEYIIFTIIFIVVCFFIYTKIKRYFFSTLVKSSIDGRYYLVRNTKGKQESADMLARINQRIKYLLESLKISLKNNGPIPKENIILLLDRYNEESLYENIEQDNTSYTLNKKEINMCLSTRDSNEKLYDLNLLMFVCLHELAHVGCLSIGHNKEFTEFFKFLVKYSVVIGIYTEIDYSKSPQEYCGMTITNGV